MGKGSIYHAKVAQREDEYLYDEDGIIRLLSMYNYIESKTDEATVTMLNDLRSALDTDILNATERKVLALSYFLELADVDIMSLLKLKGTEVKSIREASPESIAAVMLGYRAKKLPPYKPFEAKGPDVLGEWLNAVGAGEAPVYSFTCEVQRALMRWLSEKNPRDPLAAETLRQLEDGPPVFPRDFPDYVEEYTFSGKEAFEEAYRKWGVFLVDEGDDNNPKPGWGAIRKDGVVGRRKSITVNDDGTSKTRSQWKPIYK
ncbi:hypothetical protein NSQ09_00760 [Bacillus sp. FSL W8-1202]|uniref:hypothetical protein n=1 Tax=Bacillus sp. FSL W8-1202 TaxID=2954649 RepID=UPI002E23A5E2|nr:hypothetical protein [Bacillus subtilis]